MWTRKITIIATRRCLFHSPTFCFFNHDNGLAAALGDYSNWNTHESVSSLIAKDGQKAASSLQVALFSAGCFFCREFRPQRKIARIQMNQPGLSLRQNRPAVFAHGFDFLPTRQCRFILRGIHAHTWCRCFCFYCPACCFVRTICACPSH